MSEEEVKKGWDPSEDFVYFRDKVKQHWIFAAIVVGTCITAFVMSFYLVRSIIVDNLLVNWGIANLGDLSVGRSFYGVLWIFLWEFVLIVLPTLILLGAVCGVYWLKVVPEEERTELKERMKSKEKKEKREWKERHGEHAGEFSGVVGLGMLIKIAVDGFWLAPFSTVEINYFLEAWLTVIGWLALIFGVPALIFGIFIMLYKKE